MVINTPKFSQPREKRGRVVEEKLRRCIERHPQGIDYSKTDFTKSLEDEVIFVCRDHGPFRKTLRMFLRVKTPCEECLKKNRLKKRMTGLNPNFSYGKTDFSASEQMPTIVTCLLHGDVQVSLYDHKRFKTGGCQKCKSALTGDNKRSNLASLLRRAEEIYGKNTYDYSKITGFKSQHDLVTIICKKKGHGEFQKSLANHLHKRRPQGCPICGMAKGSDKQALTQLQFLEKAQAVHEQKYDYSAVKFSRSKDKVFITCRTCGSGFKQTINDHLSGSGCLECGKRKTADANRTLTTELVVRRCKEVWGNRYDYSKTEYIDTDTPLKVICPKHGEILVNYHNHVGLKRGCKFCGSTRRQKQNDWLDYLGVPDNHQSREVTIKFNDGTRCFVDGFDGGKNIVYEFNGDYFHGNPKVYPSDQINRFTGRSMLEELERTQRKKKKLKAHGYKVIDIWESAWDRMIASNQKKKNKVSK